MSRLQIKYAFGLNWKWPKPLSCSLSAIVIHGLKMSACTYELLSQLL